MVNSGDHLYTLSQLRERIVSRCSPVQLEVIAQQALTDGAISGQTYLVIKYSVPLPGSIKKTRRELTAEIGTNYQQIVGQLEHRGYEVLDRYYCRPTKCTAADRIEYLPWPRNNLSSQAINALTRHFGRDPSIQDVKNLLDSADKNGRIKIHNFGKVLILATREVLMAAEFDMPDIRQD